MLKKLSVKNLGCFDEQVYSIEFSEETLLAGPNSSGKSMFIAGMNLLRYFIITGSLNWSTAFYNLVGFGPAVYSHETDRIIEISATLLENSSEYTYEMSIGKGNKVDWYVNKERNRRNLKDINLMRKIWSFRPNRSPVPYTARVQPTAGPLQPLNSNGSNVINYLLERWTARDKRWDVAESWLKKIDPEMSEMRTPIKGSEVSFETMFGNIPVNVSLQGSGFQSAAAIIAAVVFSPKDSTIIIEEPEVFLHPDSQEAMVDMINDAVNNQGKQLIFSTHSCNVLLPFFNDIGQGAARRTGEHIRADPQKFSMYVFQKISGKVSIEQYPLREKTFRQFREDFRHIWG